MCLQHCRAITNATIAVAANGSPGNGAGAERPSSDRQTLGSSRNPLAHQGRTRLNRDWMPQGCLKVEISS